MKIERLVVGAFEVNCYLVWQTAAQGALVVDPGAEAETVLAALKRHRLAAAAYLVTHGHADHISALCAVWEQARAPVRMHAGDMRWAFSAANQILPCYPAPGRPADVSRIEDGEERTDAGLTYRVLSTPGHTPGGVCFFFPKEKIVFTGDTLFADSAGRTDFPGGDGRALARSLRTLAALPADVRVCAGHGPDSTIGEEQQSNPFLAGPR